jgi:hypothetical protein
MMAEADLKANYVTAGADRAHIAWLDQWWRQMEHNGVAADGRAQFQVEFKVELNQRDPHRFMIFWATDHPERGLDTAIQHAHRQEAGRYAVVAGTKLILATYLTAVRKIWVAGEIIPREWSQPWLEYQSMKKSLWGTYGFPLSIEQFADLDNGRGLPKEKLIRANQRPAPKSMDKKLVNTQMRCLLCLRELYVEKLFSDANKAALMRHFMFKPHYLPFPLYVMQDVISKVFG